MNKCGKSSPGRMVEPFLEADKKAPGRNCAILVKGGRSMLGALSQGERSAGSFEVYARDRALASGAAIADVKTLPVAGRPRVSTDTSKRRGV